MMYDPDFFRPNTYFLCGHKGLCNNYLEGGGGGLRLIGGPELKPKRRVGGVRCNFLNICRGVRS